MDSTENANTFSTSKWPSEPYFCERYKYQCSYLNWLKNYNLKHKFMLFSPVQNLMHHPLPIFVGEHKVKILSTTFLASNIKHPIFKWCSRSLVLTIFFASWDQLIQKCKHCQKFFCRSSLFGRRNLKKSLS